MSAVFEHAAQGRARRGFTLLELLVVLGIMGILGSIAVGGYRAMARGMEKRGSLQNLNAFIRSAYQRAQIDRQPTVIYFWNETLRPRSQEEVELVVGKAVAVRRSGRISRVDGSVLMDEFADLNQTYMAEGADGDGADVKVALLDLYPMDKLPTLASSTTLKRSLVRAKVALKEDVVDDGVGGVRRIPGYGFVVEDMGGVSWKQGMAYGFEFQRLTLPVGFIFGSDWSDSVQNPITPAGTLVFDIGLNRNSGLNTGGTVGRNTISVKTLVMKNATLSAEPVGDSEPPDRGL